MKTGKELIPVLLLGSGAALTVAGLAVMVAYGTKAPIAALALLIAGLVDGTMGLAWTVVMLFARRDEASGGAGGMGARRGRAPGPGPESTERIEKTRQSLVLASGLMAVIFLGAVLALLLYLHVIVSCLRSWRLF